ncbi:hypothetical protein AA0242T_1309 [Acetobacter aceti NRIC 0242]|nr:hypothetical protein AA0242T_1309 [Acetobacter aceti NRIC 0242]
MPSVSPGRGARVVMETECFRRGSAARKALAMVDFPAPDGAEMTRQTPRRVMGDGTVVPVRVISAFVPPCRIERFSRLFREDGCDLLAAGS